MYYKTALNGKRFKSLTEAKAFLGLTGKTGFAVIKRYYSVSFSQKGVSFTTK